MIHIVYASTATYRMEHAELESMLSTARRKNALNSITGMLLHKNGYYMQVLEGPEDNSLDIYNNIRQDPRHKSITTLRVETILHRSFAISPLGYHDLDYEAPPALLRLVGNANRNFSPDYFKEHTNEAFRLLLSFVYEPSRH